MQARDVQPAALTGPLLAQFLDERRVSHRKRTKLGALELLLGAPQKRRASIFRPSERTAKCPRPRSRPIVESMSGRISGSVSTTKLAKYRPALALITVTVDGVSSRRMRQEYPELVKH